MVIDTIHTIRYPPIIARDPHVDNSASISNAWCSTSHLPAEWFDPSPFPNLPSGTCGYDSTFELGRYSKCSSSFSHIGRSNIPAASHPPKYQQHYLVSLSFYLILALRAIFWPRGHNNPGYFRIRYFATTRVTSVETQQH